MIRIILADDQAMVRETLQFHLEPELNIEVVGTAENGLQAIDLVEKLHPDVVLLDLEMPVMDGLTATHEIRQRFPNTKVLVLTSHEDELHLNQALKAGVQGYLLKTTPAKELANAIESVYKGYVHLGPELSGKYLGQNATSSLNQSSSRSTAQEPTASALATVGTDATALTTAPPSQLSRTDVTTDSALERFDRPVVLQQSPIWSRVIIWSIVGITAAAVTWASVFKIEEAIPATGQLEPQGAVKDVQVPVSGVVREVNIEDGQRVKKGDILLRLNPKATESELAYLNQTRKALQQENSFYRSQLQGNSGQQLPTQLPPDMLSLAESRRALVAENQLFRAQVNGSSSGINLTPEQRLRLRSSQEEEVSRTQAAELRVGQLQKQLRETQIQLASARKGLALNQGILDDITPLAKDGALAKVQYLRQVQEVETGKAEVERLNEEEARLGLAIAEGKQELVNTVSTGRKNLLQDIANNDKQIADIDSRFTKQIVDNQNQMADIENRLRQAKLTLQYQELKAPADGIVFDLKAHTPGFVVNASEPILKIVPTENLLAKVFITNKDIGFIKTGMDVDVRVDSFPFSEFGDLKGTLEWIGSDALEPTETRPFFNFPARVRLKTQKLKLKQRELLLQSGMSISANIKVRKRTILSIFTDQFTRQLEHFKNLR